MAGARFYRDDMVGAPVHSEQLCRPAASSQLRLIVCGSVDDGKSTLIGRMLYEAGSIHDDQFAALEDASHRFGTTGGDIDFALLVDGLEDERRQGITIDVGYRFFATARRSFVVADTPGHEQYTRNMATGASNAEVAVILIDARKGVLPQTRRHAVICWLFGIRHFVVAVNKMDLVEWDEAVFGDISARFVSFARRLAGADVAFVPISARFGDNVTASSGKMAWFAGPSLLDHLEAVEIDAHAEARPFRFSVQFVSRPHLDLRGYAGTVASGRIGVGDRVQVAGSTRLVGIDRILTADGDLSEARAGDAVTLVLDQDVDVGRGDLIHTADAPPQVSNQFAAHLIWMVEDPLLPGRQYIMRIANRHVPVSVTTIKYRLDVNEFSHFAATEVALNEIAVCNLSTSAPISFDAFGDDPATGAFILIDRTSNATVGAGMIDFGLRRADNIHRQTLSIDKAARAGLIGQRPAIVWFTGLSGSGKSTIANELERQLHAAGRVTYLLDGDNVRLGLNRDLGFTDADRVENIRRVGEVAKLFVDAGLIVICAFISPFASERLAIRELVGADEYVEVFVDTPIDICIARDPKGLYAKALAGKMTHFTGFDSSYERPASPELRLDSTTLAPSEAADRIMALMRDRGVI